MLGITVTSHCIISETLLLGAHSFTSPCMILIYSAFALSVTLSVFHTCLSVRCLWRWTGISRLSHPLLPTTTNWDLMWTCWSVPTTCVWTGQSQKVVWGGHPSWNGLHTHYARFCPRHSATILLLIWQACKLYAVCSAPSILQRECTYVLEHCQHNR